MFLAISELMNLLSPKGRLGIDFKVYSCSCQFCFGYIKLSGRKKNYSSIDNNSKISYVICIILDCDCGKNTFIVKYLSDDT